MVGSGKNGWEVMIEGMPGLKSEDLGSSSGLKKPNGSAACFPDLWEEMKEAYGSVSRGPGEGAAHDRRSANGN